MKRFPTLAESSRAGGAPRMWTRILGRALPHAQALLPPGSLVLEVGYGDGLLSCHLAGNFGWRIVGLDSDAQAQATARANAAALGLEEALDFRLVKPDETWSFKGQYDGVFIKTVLYNAASCDQYARWLDWVVSVLKPGGVFVNFENGKANRLTYLYRKLRRRYYADLCMYDGGIHELYEKRFHFLYLEHFGAMSQFAASIPPAYWLLAFFEERCMPRTADNSYVTALVAQKPDP